MSASTWCRLACVLAAGMVCLATVQAQIGRPLEPGDDPLRDRWRLDPERLDDELFIAGNIDGWGSAFGIAYPQPRHIPGGDAPASLYRRFEGLSVLAGAAGRVLGTPFHQVALVTADAGGTHVDIFSGLLPGQVHIGRYTLPPPCPSESAVNCRVAGSIEIAVADLDGFDQSRPDLGSGNRCLETNRRHDEVAVGYPYRIDDGEGGTAEHIQLRILSWEGIEREDAVDQPPSPPGAVIGGLHTRDIDSRRFRLIPAQFFSARLSSQRIIDRDLLVAYLGEPDHTSPDTEGFDIVTEGFRLERDLGGDCATPGDYLTAPVNFGHDSGDDENASNAPDTYAMRIGGPVPFDSPESWDALAGLGQEFEMDINVSGGFVQPLDVVVAAWPHLDGGQSDGLIRIQTTLQSTTGSGIEIRNSSSYPIAARNGEDLLLLPDAGIRLDVGKITLPGGTDNFQVTCFAQGVYILGDTEYGPVIQAIYVGGNSGGDIQPANVEGTNEPVWPDAQTLSNRPPTTARENIAFAVGGFMRDRDRPGIDRDQRCQQMSLFTGDADTLYVVRPDASPFPGDNDPQFEVVGIGDRIGDTLDPVVGHGLTRPLDLLGMPDHRATPGPDFVSVNMDIDGDGQVDPATDGQLILRFLMGLRGAALTASGTLVAPECRRCTDGEIQDYLEDNAREYDADANSIADALSDGLLRLRFMQGALGGDLTSGVVSANCRRCSTEDFIAYLPGPLDRPVTNVPVIIPLDADANAPHYRRFESGVGSIYLAEGSSYILRDVEAFDIILTEPPKHLDWLPDLGGITNISTTSDFYTEFETETTSSQTISKETVSDWTLSESESVTRTANAGVDLFGVVDTSVEGSITDLTENEFTETSSDFQSETSSVSITQVSTAERDDQVVNRLMDLHVWRYPAMGMRNADGTPANPRFFEIHQPTPSLSFFSGGRTNDAYQPWHQNHNLLTYPVFTGQSFIPADDEVGEFSGGGGPAQVVPLWAENAFTVGGLTFSQAIEYFDATGSEQTLTTSNTVTQSRDTSVKASVDIAGSFKGIGVSAGFSEERNWSASESFSYAETDITSNEASDRTTIRLVIPGDIPGERGYRFHPAWFFTPDGGLKLTHAVALEGMGVIPESFWQAHYSAPDPALNLPFRFTLDAGTTVPDTFLLNTDPSRKAIKGLFFRDGRGINPRNPSDETGTDLSFTPRVGDPVQLEVRVYNLSVGTPVENLKVRFEAQRYELGQETGPRIPLGETRIPGIPYRGQVTPDPGAPLTELAHVGNAYLMWDTTDFGPDDPDSLATWRVYVTLDPDNEIPDETHELVDRHDDPLTDINGNPVDPLPGQVNTFLEKGQNNTGWGLIRIAPAPEDGDDTRSAAPASTLVVDAAHLDATGRRIRSPEPVPVGSTTRLRLTLASDALSTRTHRVLVYDGHPDQGGRAIAYRRITGMDAGGIDELIHWIPAERGSREIHVVSVERDANRRSQTVHHGAVLTVEVE